MARPKTSQKRPSIRSPQEGSKAVKNKDVERLYRLFLRVVMAHWNRVKQDLDERLDRVYGVGQPNLATRKIAPKGQAGVSPLAADFVFGIEAIVDRTDKEVRYRYGLDDASDWRIESMETYESIKSAALDLCDTTLADMEAETGRKAESLIESVRGDLLAGQKAGITRGQLSNQVAQYFSETARWKARRIARTEASRGVNTGYLTSTAKQDWVVGYEWLMAGDACELCVKVGTVDGRPRRWRKGDLVATDSAARRAYSSILTPPLHPNCFCGIVPILDFEDVKDFDPPADLVEAREQVWQEQDDSGVAAVATPKPSKPKPKPVPKRPTSHLAPATPAPAKPAPAPAPALANPVTPTVAAPAPKPLATPPVAQTGTFDSRWYDPNLIENKADKLEASVEYIKRRASDMGVAESSYREFIDRGKKIIQNESAGFKRVPVETVEAMLAGEPRFKSQFETGRSEGTMSTTLRSKVEQTSIGFDPGNNVKHRPQYGYLSHDDELHEDLVESALFYGEAKFKLKPGVLNRVTVTGANSLGMRSKVYAQPLKGQPLDDNVARGTLGRLPYSSKPLTAKEYYRKSDGYNEIQIPGGLTLDDMEAVSFPKSVLIRRPHLRAMLEKKGIKVHERKVK
jgi:hypothetical protein